MGKKPEPTSDDIPDLKSLAEALMGAGQVDFASPKAEPATAPPPAAAAPRPSAPAPVTASEERPTDEYAAAAARPSGEAAEIRPSGETGIEEKLTSPYNPSVSKLVRRLEAPEVAPEPAEHPDLTALRLMIPSVQGHIADLKEHASPEDPRRPHLVELARTTAAEASALLARTPASEEFAQRREELTHLQLILERLIAAYTPKAAPKAVSKAAVKAQPQASAVDRAVLADEQKYRRRRNMLVLFVGLLLAGRLALLLPGSVPSPIEQTRGASGEVSVVNHSAGATEAELAEGLPSVMEVAVAQEEDGALRARALAIDPNGDPITLSFKWFENGQVAETEALGLLAAHQVAAGSSYEVEVTASDLTHRSPPLRTPSLVAERGGKGTIGITPLPKITTKKKDDAKGLPRKGSSGHHESEKTKIEKPKPRGAHK